VKVQFKILTGARAGHTEVFSKPFLGVGRHPASDLKLDPQKDLDVSARHCAILMQEDRWYVRDLGSRNGTLVNGHPISRDTKLDDTDQIQLGPNGPKLEVRLVPATTPDGVIGQAVPIADAPAVRDGRLRETAAGQPGGLRAPPRPPPPPPASSSRPSTTQRIRVEVGRQTKKLRTATMVLFGMLVVVAGVFFWQTRVQEQRREREVAAAQARTDSILAAADEAMRALQGQVEGLASALAQSQGEVSRLQDELTSAQQSGNADQIAAAQQRLNAATQALQVQQMAARVDYRGIVARNQHAVAMIWVRFPNGDVQTATAFAVRPEAILITNRHVVAGPQGDRQPARDGIRIRFADSDQTWRGRVLAVSSAADADLAVIQALTDRGSVVQDVPTVQSLSQRPDTIHQGDPVAMIGFPLGENLPMDAVARTTFTAGSISKVIANLIQVDGYGAEGASGTPIFDQSGEVVAILYGGQAGSGGRIVFGVPSTYALQLLESIGR